MRICFVNSTRKWGGVKSWTLDVCQGLAGRGHDVSIIARPGSFVDKAVSLGIQAKAVSFGPDSIHCSSSACGTGFVPKKSIWSWSMWAKTYAARHCRQTARNPVVHRVGRLETWKTPSKCGPCIADPSDPACPCAQVKKACYANYPISPSEIAVVLTGKEPAPNPPHISALCALFPPAN